MKAQISKVLRNLGLIKVADRIRYYFHLARTRKSRNLFIEKYPKVVLPPPYFLYETFGLNYFSYYEDGRDTAEWLINYFSEYKKLENINILDWGCGPARIIRHLPSLVGSTCNCYGSDYNPQYIEWCTKTFLMFHFPLTDWNLHYCIPPNFLILPMESQSLHICQKKCTSSGLRSSCAF